MAEDDSVWSCVFVTKIMALLLVVRTFRCGLVSIYYIS
jgi:hypothetical protein